MKGKKGKYKWVTRKERSKSCSMLTVTIVFGQPNPENEVNDLAFMFKDSVPQKAWIWENLSLRNEYWIFEQSMQWNNKRSSWGRRFDLYLIKRSICLLQTRYYKKPYLWGVLLMNLMKGSIICEHFLLWIRPSKALGFKPMLS